MGKLLQEISDKEASFIASQKVFFVATAPLSADHHVSVSPKAGGCVVLDSKTVMYGDLTGSGAETAAHIMQNGRMTLMFTNIEAGPPKILRLFGTAELFMPENVPRSLLDKLPKEITSSPGFRAVYKLRVTRITSSCGYSMPIMEYKRHRNILNEFADSKGMDGMFEYKTLKNSFSIDGLPSLAQLRKDAPPIIPIEQEGYIWGQVRTEAEDSSSLSKTTSKIASSSKLELQSYNTTRNKNNMIYGLFATACLVAAFLCGVVAGPMLYPQFCLILHHNGA